MGSAGVGACLHLNSMRGASGYLICLQCGADVDSAAESLVTAASEVIEALPSTTLPTVPGYVIVKELGIVSAEVVHGMGMGRDILAGLTNTFGGRSGAFERGLSDSRQQVIFAMKAQAHARGASGLAGAAFDQQLLGGQSGSAAMLLVTGTATAVVLEPVGPGQPT
jgi:uncharacterized protein YbjQ (UPF0145 family)